MMEMKKMRRNMASMEPKRMMNDDVVVDVFCVMVIEVEEEDDDRDASNEGAKLIIVHLQ